MDKSRIKLEINCIAPERFINFLWENGINLEKVKKSSIVSYTFKIPSKDLKTVMIFAEDKKVKVRLLKTFGFCKMKNKVLSRKAFILGIFIFIALIYYFSMFIWTIKIKTENNVSPYEIRYILKNMGVKPGIKKKQLDVFKIENKILEENKNVVWIRARIEGTNLHVEISERQNPPKILKENNSPCDLVAKKDGVIQRVYTKSGTAIVEEGQVVKKGDVLVRGEQGNEESRYQVKAEGDVIAKTFYENTKNIKIPKVKRKRTGKALVNKFIEIKGKRIYIKNNLNKFKKYDKIEDNNHVIKKEIYYEVKELKFTKDDEKKLVDEELNKMYSDIRIHFDHSIKIIQKMQDYDKQGETYNLRVLVIAEEELGEEKEIAKEEIENNITEDKKEVE